MKDKYIQCAICNVEIKQRNFKKNLLMHNISEKDYEAAIRQWTQSDVLKRQTAKQNKLN